MLFELMQFTQIVYAGNASLLLPVAAALAVWLMAGGLVQLSLRWCLLFAAGLGIVLLSKIAHTVWGTGIAALHFKALSGHAFLVTAIYPVAIFSFFNNLPSQLRTAGVILGVVFGAVMGICLVVFGFHSASEAIGGYLLGAMVSIGYLHIVGSDIRLYRNRWQVLLSILVFFLVYQAKPAVMEYRITCWVLNPARNLFP